MAVVSLSEKVSEYIGSQCSVGTASVTFIHPS